MSRIKVNNLNRTYNIVDGMYLKQKQQLFQDLNFEMEQGEFVSVIGPSGSGKSTLLHIIGGLDTLDSRGEERIMDAASGKWRKIPAMEGSGQVTIAGQDLMSLKGDRRARFINANIGFIFQFHHLIPELTALQNVALPMRIANSGKRTALACAQTMLERVGLGKDAGKSPAILSGGERQRVAIARALVNQPKILLADEPTGGLHPDLKEEIFQIFMDLNSRDGLTILMVTHEVDLVKRVDGTARIGRIFDLGQLVGHRQEREVML